MKRFLVIGGNCMNPEGKIAYLFARDIARLYKAAEKECVFAVDDDDPKVWTYRKDPSMIVLRPRPDGKYDLENMIKAHEKALRKSVSGEKEVV